VTGLAGCRSLRVLRLDGNLIEAIGTGLLAVQGSLEELDLSGNFIWDLAEVKVLGQCKRLTRLNLTGCSLTSIASFHAKVAALVPSLEVLNDSAVLHHHRPAVAAVAGGGSPASAYPHNNNSTMPNSTAYGPGSPTADSVGEGLMGVLQERMALLLESAEGLYDGQAGTLQSELRVLRSTLRGLEARLERARGADASSLQHEVASLQAKAGEAAAELSALETAYRHLQSQVYSVVSVQMPAIISVPGARGYLQAALATLPSLDAEISGRASGARVLESLREASAEISALANRWAGAAEGITTTAAAHARRPTPPLEPSAGEMQQRVQSRVAEWMDSAAERISDSHHTDLARVVGEDSMWASSLDALDQQHYQPSTIYQQPAPLTSRSAAARTPSVGLRSREGTPAAAASAASMTATAASVTRQMSAGRSPSPLPPRSPVLARPASSDEIVAVTSGNHNNSNNNINNLDDSFYTANIAAVSNELHALRSSLESASQLHGPQDHTGRLTTPFLGMSPRPRSATPQQQVIVAPPQTESNSSHTLEQVEVRQELVYLDGSGRIVSHVLPTITQSGSEPKAIEAPRAQKGSVSVVQPPRPQAESAEAPAKTTPPPTPAPTPAPAPTPSPAPAPAPASSPAPAAPVRLAAPVVQRQRHSLGGPAGMPFYPGQPMPFAPPGARFAPPPPQMMYGHPPHHSHFHPLPPSFAMAPQPGGPVRVAQAPPQAAAPVRVAPPQAAAPQPQPPQHTLGMLVTHTRRTSVDSAQRRR
jgi:hypothetical protein